jgi:hypothetical protein
LYFFNRRDAENAKFFLSAYSAPLRLNIDSLVNFAP